MAPHGRKAPPMPGSALSASRRRRPRPRADAASSSGRAGAARARSPGPPARCAARSMSPPGPRRHRTHARWPAHRSVRGSGRRQSGQRGWRGGADRASHARDRRWRRSRFDLVRHHPIPPFLRRCRRVDPPGTIERRAPTPTHSPARRASLAAVSRLRKGGACGVDHGPTATSRPGGRFQSIVDFEGDGFRGAESTNSAALAVRKRTTSKTPRWPPSFNGGQLKLPRGAPLLT